MGYGGYVYLRCYTDEVWGVLTSFVGVRVRACKKLHRCDGLTLLYRKFDKYHHRMKKIFISLVLLFEVMATPTYGGLEWQTQLFEHRFKGTDITLKVSTNITKQKKYL